MKRYIIAIFILIYFIKKNINQFNKILEEKREQCKILDSIDYLENINEEKNLEELKTDYKKYQELIDLKSKKDVLEKLYISKNKIKKEGDY